MDTWENRGGGQEDPHTLGTNEEKAGKKSYRRAADFRL